MKINKNKLLVILNKIRIFLKKVLYFFEFIIEELPSIFSILIIPTSLGYFLLLPKATTWTSLVASLLVEIYLIIKSGKKFPKFDNKLGWQIALIITSLFFGFLVVLITLVTKTNLELGLRLQK